jgi:surface polysaccharide O-acyltransferase-like enzyme
MRDKKRLDNLDLLKMIGIMMVLSLHVPLLYPDFFEANTAGRIIQYALRLVAEGVPLFMMVNGILLLKKSDFVFEKHMRKVLDIFKVFLVWAAIYIILNSLLQIPIEKLSFASFFRYIFYTNVGSQYTGVLWCLQNL